MKVLIKYSQSFPPMQKLRSNISCVSCFVSIRTLLLFKISFKKINSNTFFNYRPKQNFKKRTCVISALLLSLIFRLVIMRQDVLSRLNISDELW